MGTVHPMRIYNDSPFFLQIKIQGNDPESMESNPSTNRIININCTRVYMKIQIRAIDKTKTVIKTASFYSMANHSWIVNDESIRRQNGGSEVYIADEVKETETAEYHNNYTPNDEAWLYENRALIKYYPWDNKLCDKKIQLFDEVDEERIASFNLSSLNFIKLPISGDPMIQIYNTTPYVLQIELYDQENNDLLLIWWSHPQIDRISSIKIDSTSFISIYAMDSCGTTLKNVTFYSHHAHSWIVGDECIRRKRSGSSFYVADVCKDSDKESFYSLNPGYLMKFYNEMKCYEWKQCVSGEMTLFQSKSRIQSTKPRQMKTFFSQSFVDALQFSGFSSMTEIEKNKAMGFINCDIKASVINTGHSAGTNITNNQQIGGSYPGFRLDLEGQDSDKSFDRFSIQVGIRTFASVHVQMLLGVCNDEFVRHAFRTSLENSKDVWLTDENNTRQDNTNYVYGREVISPGLVMCIRSRHEGI